MSLSYTCSPKKLLIFLKKGQKGMNGLRCVQSYCLDCKDLGALNGPWSVLRSGSSWVAPNHAFHRDPAERPLCACTVCALDLTMDLWMDRAGEKVSCQLRQAWRGCGWVQWPGDKAFFQEQGVPWKAFEQKSDSRDPCGSRKANECRVLGESWKPWAADSDREVEKAEESPQAW